MSKSSKRVEIYVQAAPKTTEMQLSRMMLRKLSSLQDDTSPWLRDAHLCHFEVLPDFDAPPKIKIEEEEHLNITIDNQKRGTLGLTLAAVSDAIREFSRKPQTSLRSLRRAVIAEVNGKKIRLRDIAEVEVTTTPSHRIYRWPGVEEKK